MPNNVFEGLDEILARQKQAEERSRQEHEEILEAINKVNAKAAEADQVQRTVNQRNQSWSLKNFINRSIHEYMWLGTRDEFEKDKSVATLFTILSIVGICLCSIVTTATVGFYTTYTFFENIWLFLLLFVCKYVMKAQKNYSTLEYSQNSFERFTLDADGVLRPGPYKKKYKWFLILAVISFILNAICNWGSLIALLLEVLVLGLNLFTVYKVTDFFAGYGPIRFIGMNDRGTAKVVIIFDTLQNKLYTEEDYLKQFPLMK